VISPSQGLYLHRTTQHRKTRTNIHALSGIRTHDPSNQPATVAGGQFYSRPKYLNWYIFVLRHLVLHAHQPNRFSIENDDDNNKLLFVCVLNTFVEIQYFSLT
jgi:hypothetical protein